MYRNYIEKIAENLTNEDLLNDWQKVKKGITNNRRKKASNITNQDLTSDWEKMKNNTNANRRKREMEESFRKSNERYSTLNKRIESDMNPAGIINTENRVANPVNKTRTSHTIIPKTQNTSSTIDKLENEIAQKNKQMRRETIEKKKKSPSSSSSTSKIKRYGGPGQRFKMHKSTPTPSPKPDTKSGLAKLSTKSKIGLGAGALALGAGATAYGIYRNSQKNKEKTAYDIVVNAFEKI